MRKIWLLFLIISYPSFSQTIAELDSLVEVGKAQEAKNQLQHNFQEWIDQHQKNKLPEYLEVYGRVLSSLSNEDQANQEVESKIKSWEKLMTNAKDKKDLWLAAASWYEYLSKNNLAFESKSNALAFARQQEDISPKELGTLLVGLSGYAVNNMDIPVAKKYLKEAEELLKDQNDPESIYRINSYLGSMAYYSSKLDTSEYYFYKCLDAFKQMEPTLRNTHFRPAIILNNLSGIQSFQGKTTEAITSLNEVIRLEQYYLEHEKDPSLRQNALVFYLQALDNLGGIYKSLGNYQRAQELLEFSYHEKQSSLPQGSKDIWLSEIFLGQLYFEQGDSDKSRIFLEKGIDGLRKTSGNFDIYEADAIYALGRIEDADENEDLAEEYYRQSYRILDNNLGEELDLVYLGFLNNFSKFLSEVDKGEEAVQLAQKAYSYIQNNLGKESLLAFEQELTIGYIYLEIEDYPKASEWSSQALQTLGHQLDETSTLLDTIRNERFKPLALMLKNKAAVQSNPDLEPENIQEIIHELESGLEVIERSKSYFESESDLNILLEEHRDYFKFLEEMYLKLYQQTGKEEFLGKLLIVHESALYQQIRSRMSQIEITKFGNMPASYFEEEKELKAAVSQSISDEDADLSKFLQATKDWEKFLSDSRQKYPDYYKFRYASLDRPISEIINSIPKDITVVRYLELDKKLAALVISGENKTIKVKVLDQPKIEALLANSLPFQNSEKIALASYHDLYQELWKPFAGDVQTERVIVVPDGILFTINFELLTPQLLENYSQLASGSLLAKHSFSYNYSTLLFDYPNQQKSDASNFVAFAPGFFDDMKSEYLASVSDSFQIDQSYLKLIPQPFTDKLVKEIKNKLGGSIFSKKASTVTSFGSEAGNHKIIHIGTHAESNNSSPEYSRLIFAKTNAGEENSLFAKDIYQMDLPAELAVLMACETGKPTYQPGEGMISLAHAFNYAGSKSMLIGLWKIDEQTSSIIAKQFYYYLAEGMSKDMALRQAKLDYLAQSNSRALSPEFWAGLVLLGDAHSIDLQEEDFSYLFLGIAALVVCLGGVLLIRSKKANRK